MEDDEIGNPVLFFPSYLRQSRSSAVDFRTPSTPRSTKCTAISGRVPAHGKTASTSSGETVSSSGSKRRSTATNTFGNSETSRPRQKSITCGGRPANPIRRRMPWLYGLSPSSQRPPSLSKRSVRKFPSGSARRKFIHLCDPGAPTNCSRICHRSALRKLSPHLPSSRPQVPIWRCPGNR